MEYLFNANKRERENLNKIHQKHLCESLHVPNSECMVMINYTYFISFYLGPILIHDKQMIW